MGVLLRGAGRAGTASRHGWRGTCGERRATLPARAVRALGACLGVRPEFRASPLPEALPVAGALRVPGVCGGSARGAEASLCSPGADVQPRRVQTRSTASRDVAEGGAWRVTELRRAWGADCGGAEGGVGLSKARRGSSARQTGRGNGEARVRGRHTRSGLGVRGLPEARAGLPSARPEARVAHARGPGRGAVRSRRRPSPSRTGIGQRVPAGALRSATARLGDSSPTCQGWSGTTGLRSRWPGRRPHTPSCRQRQV